MSGGLAAVVPTLGRSPHLGACLDALRRDAGPELDLIVVDQGPEGSKLPAALGARRLRLGENRGFAGGTNAGLAAARKAGARFVAAVNDDAVVAPGWTAALLSALAAEPRAAAAQGAVLLEAPPTDLDSQPGADTPLDGLGIGWNRWWQADQVAVGRPWSEVVGELEAGGLREIFGVSATAAIYRVEALEDAGSPAARSDFAPFDPRLESYYEDVDLALRLRGGGWRSLLVPSARAWHAGSLTGQSLGHRRGRLVIGNRYLVLARALGRAFFPRLPAMALRDAWDLLRAAAGRHAFGVRGMVAGLGRAVLGLPGRCHLSAPSPPPFELRRFPADRLPPQASGETDHG